MWVPAVEYVKPKRKRARKRRPWAATEVLAWRKKPVWACFAAHSCLLSATRVRSLGLLLGQYGRMACRHPHSPPPELPLSGMQHRNQLPGIEAIFLCEVTTVGKCFQSLFSEKGKKLKFQGCHSPPEMSYYDFPLIFFSVCYGNQFQATPAIQVRKWSDPTPEHRLSLSLAS